MAVTRDQDVHELLTNLIHLDYDALEAYDVAIDRLEDPTASSRLREFRADHERHIRELSECMVEIGAEPPRGADYRRVLTQGKVYLGSISGTDAILKAMKSNEDDTTSEYERALADTRGFPNPRLREVLERCVEDERRHRSWIRTQIA